MESIPLVEFKDRVVTSRERVQFSHIDPYGHLNTARYAEYVINHRITAVEDCVQVSTMDILKDLGVAFVVTRLDLQFHAPTYMGETLEIASWVAELSPTGFSLRVVLSGQNDQRVRASARMELRTVSATTGKLQATPDHLPTRGPRDVIERLPLARAYLARLKGVPPDFAGA